MSYIHCIARLNQAAGRELTDAEIEGVYKRIHQAALDIKAGRAEKVKGDAFDNVVADAAKKAAADLIREAEEQARRAQLQVVKLSARMREVSNVAAQTGEPARLDALDRTHFRNFDGKADVQSFEDRVTGLQSMYGSKLLDTWAAFGKDFFGFWQDRGKLSNLLREVLGEDTGDALAKKGAKAWSDTVETLRQDFNRAGGHVGKLDEGYLPQGWWSQEKIAKLGPDKFREMMLPVLKKTQAKGKHYTDGGIPWDEARLTQFIDKAYDTISTNGHANTKPGEFKGVSGAANRHAEHRQIHFPDAESVIRAWEVFGEKTPIEIMQDHVHAMARDIALVEHYGPNHQTTIRTLIDQAKKADILANRGKIEQIEAKANRMQSYIDYTTGKTEPIAHPRFSRFISTMIPLNVAGKLGGAFWASAIGDKPMMEAVSHLNNLPPLQRWAKELAVLNPKNAEMRRDLMRQGLMLEHLNSGLLRFGDQLGAAPLANKLANAVMRMTLMSFVNAGRKGAFGAQLMDSIGHEIKRGVEFKDLHDSDSRILKNYGITEADWNIWKQAQIDDLGRGYTMLTPEAISRISDADIAAQIPTRLQGLRDQMQAHIAELEARNQQEAGWIAGRADKIKQAQDSGNRLIKKLAKTREANADKYRDAVQARIDLMNARLEQAQVRADIDAATASLKSADEVRGMLADMAFAEVEGNTSAQMAILEGKADKSVNRVAARGERIGFALGEKSGSINRRIIEAEQRVRNLEKESAAYLHGKAKDEIKRIDAMRDDLKEFIDRSTARQQRRQFVMDKIANDIEPKVTQEIAVARKESIVKLLGAINSESDFAIVTPGMKDRAQFHSIGNKAGYGGELGRAFLQFKSFPWAMFHRMGDAVANKDTPVSKAAMTAYLVTATTLAGAMMNQWQDLRDGKDPRDMTDWRFWGSAFMKGGSLGIYGDFLYGVTNTRYGTGLLETASGPTIGPLLEMGIVQPAQAIKQRMEGKESHLLAKTAQDAKGFVPGSNVWFAKPAFDHMIFQQIFEALSPGYLDSIRQRASKEYNQDFYWPPGEFTPERAPDFGAAMGD